MPLLRSLAPGTTLALASVAVAQDVRTETVRLAPGASGTTIAGYDSVRYAVAAGAGHRMSVQLDPSNPSAFLAVTAPGASEALHDGSIEGDGTSFVVPSSGAHVVDVTLMRNVAPRRAG